MNHWILFLYGIILVSMGLLGYVKAHSLPSLIMGSISGLFMIACGFLMNRWPKQAELTAIVFSGLLTLFFSFRFFTTQQFFPAGLMALVSLIVTFLLYSGKNR